MVSTYKKSILNLFRFSPQYDLNKFANIWHGNVICFVEFLLQGKETRIDQNSLTYPRSRASSAVCVGADGILLFCAFPVIRSRSL